MQKTNISALPDFSDLHIVVIGDVMIDRYIYGMVKRISPEAPVPILDMHNNVNKLGGAANVAANIKALGAKVTLISIIGDDDEGKMLLSILQREGLDNRSITEVANRKTTLKTRVMAGNQQLLRIDQEDAFDIEQNVESIILNTYIQILENTKVDGIILQDYNKGLLTENLITKLMNIAQKHKIDTFVDPKEKNFFAYKDCTVFKPNKKEVRHATNIHTEDYESISAYIKQKLQNTLTVITLGSQGIYMHNGQNGTKYDTSPRVIADVCGAGDSVISIICLCYLKNIPLSDMALMANLAGGQVCEYPGVVVVNRDKLLKELDENTFT